MSPVIAPGIEVSDGQLDEYRQILQQARQSVETYNGTEAVYHQLMDVLTALETWMSEATGTTPQIPANIEQALFAAAHPEAPNAVTINSMLDRFSEIYRQLFQQPYLPAGILHVQTGTVVVPPETRPLEQGDGSGEVQPPQFEERLQQLMTELHNRFHIFLDDLIVHDGIVRPRMMRQSGYRAVEIPRLGWKEFLVSNQVGEALRVSQNPLGIEGYSQTKLSLDQTTGVSVIPRNLGEGVWTENAMADLARHINVNTLQKVDVRRLQDLRITIRNQYSAEEWLELSTTNAIAIQGHSFADLVHSVCGETYQDTPESRIQWAIRIFGMGNAAVSAAWENFRVQDIPELQNEQWRDELLGQFPNSEIWLHIMNNPDHLECNRHLLYAHGFSRFVVDFPSRIIGLGMRLYGRNDEILNQALLNQGSPQRQRYEATMLLPNSPFSREPTVAQLEERLECAIQFGQIGLPSLRVYRRVARLAELQLEIAEATLAHLNGAYANNIRIFDGQDSANIGYTEHMCRAWAENEAQERIENIEYAAAIALNSIPRLEQLISRSQELENTAFEQLQTDQIQNELTAILPLHQRPDLDLNQGESQLLQLLLNEGNDTWIDHNDLAWILDPQTLIQGNHLGHHIRRTFRGRVQALATSLRRKLQNNGIGSVDNRYESFRLSINSVHSSE